MFCRQCGTNNKDDARFCVGCGVAFVRPSAPLPRAPGGNRLRRWGLATVAGLVAIGGAGLAGWYFARQPAAADGSDQWPLVVTMGAKCGAVDRTGKVVVGTIFDGLRPFSNGLAAFVQGGLAGYVDEQGKIVIGARFDSASDFTGSGLAAAKSGGLWGYIDRTGQFVIQPQYAEARDFDDAGNAWIKMNDRWGLIDKDGTFLIQPQFYDVGDFSDGLAPAITGEGDKIGFVDRRGNFVIPPQFASVSGFTAQGYASVTNAENKSGLIDKTGSFVVPAVYDNLIFDGSMDLIDARQAGRSGFIDGKGRVVIPYMFDDAGPFVGSDLAPVRREGKFGYIDKSGKMVIPAKFTEGEAFIDGHAIVAGDFQKGIVDQAGHLVVEGYISLQWVFPDEWNVHNGINDRHIERIPAKISLISAEDASGHWGVMSTAGKLLIPPRFDAIECRPAPPAANDTPADAATEVAPD
jgi:hypothetical protein